MLITLRTFIHSIKYSSIDIEKIGKNNKSTDFIKTIKFSYIQANFTGACLHF